MCQKTNKHFTSLKKKKKSLKWWFSSLLISRKSTISCNNWFGKYSSLRTKTQIGNRKEMLKHASIRVSTCNLYFSKIIFMLVLHIDLFEEKNISLYKVLPYLLNGVSVSRRILIHHILFQSNPTLTIGRVTRVCNRVLIKKPNRVLLTYKET